MKRVLALLLLTAGIVSAEDDLVPFKDGATWTYDVTSTVDTMGVRVAQKGTATWTCNGKEGESTVLVLTEVLERKGRVRDLKLWVRSSPNSIEVSRTSGEELWLLPADLKTKNKSVKVKVGGADIAVETVVGDEEEVETPAGKFKAVKVTAQVSVAMTKTERSVWYAPGVGAVKAVSRVVAGPARVEKELLLRKFEKEPPKAHAPDGEPGKKPGDGGKHPKGEDSDDDDDDDE
ncbi:MAG: hypothetical protein HYZ53_28965 [Planctomycetes bacterium]|nr:hypothetical protein [Planctomycetota bacterium]